LAVIDPEGLFGGDRLAALSDKARLYWPWLYAATNGFARMELNPRAIIRRCFSAFSDPMTEAQLVIILSEYAENFLLFVFEHNGQQWIQFDTPEKNLPRHKTKKDLSSPNPTPESRSEFQKGYLEWKKSKSLYLHHSQKNSELFHENARGIGIGIKAGIGIGGGIGEGIAPAQPPLPAPKFSIPMNPMANEDVSALVQRIVMAHPRSLVRKLRFGEATYSQITAVLKSMDDNLKAAEGLRSPVQILEWILSRVEMHGHDIPPDQWQFVPKLETYFEQHDYRSESQVFIREEKVNGRPNSGTNNRVDPAKQRQQESHDAIAAAVQRRVGAYIRPDDGRGPSDEAKPDTATGNPGYVPPGVGGDRGGVRNGNISGRVVEGTP
jgi:hypothetical protein